MSEFDVGKRVKVHVEKIVSGGDGLAHLPDGRVIFIPGALPDEEINIRIDKSKKDFAKAQIESIDIPSPLRAEPKCPYFYLCGGCNMQHVKEDSQLLVKESIFKDTMRRIGGIDISELGSRFVMVEGPMWEYRTRAKFQIDFKKGQMGFLAKNSKEVIGLEFCPILDPRISEVLDYGWSNWVKKGIGPNREIQSIAGDTGAAVEKDQIIQTLSPKHLKAHSFAVDGSVFFQSNQVMFEKLIGDMLPMLYGNRAMDLFSGVGTFAAFLQDHYKQIIAVEREPRCLQFAKQNLDLAKTTFYTDSVEKWVQGRGEFGLDLLVVDPPRTGLPQSVVDIMLSWQPEWLMYVSCNPVTLARDLKDITNRGYSLRVLHGYDFYPQTTHLESVALLKRIPQLSTL